MGAYGIERALSTFVERLRPEPRSAFLTLRAMALSLGSDVTERVTPNEVTYLRREKPFVVAEAIRAKLVMNFPVGTPLDDPMGRLLRRGEHRYVRLEKADDLDGHIQEFVRRSYEAARERYDQGP